MVGSRVTILEERPDAAALMDLYRSVGWSIYTDDSARLLAGVSASTLVITARVQGRLVGLVRGLTDDATVVLVQDLLVDPALHRQGIGTSLMQALLERTSGIRQTLLLTDSELAHQAFYESLGFTSTTDVKPAPLTAYYLQR